MQSFSSKKIEIHIELGSGTFLDGSNKIVINELATLVNIRKPGLPDKAQANVQILGLSMSIMEQLTMLGFKNNEISNTKLTIYAIENNELYLIFKGEVISAFANFNTAPDITFEINAMTGYYPSLMSSSPKSYKGSVSLENILSGLAKEISYSFENQGFTGSLKNPILSGSFFEMAIQASNQAGAHLICDDCKFILLPNETPCRNEIITLSENSGLVGYPIFSNEGIQITAFYSPHYILNSLIKLQSIVPKASGIWRITSLNHTISANHSKASWFSHISAQYYNEN